MVINDKADNHELDGFLDINPDIFYVHNLEGRLVKWNKAVEILTGLGADDLMYKPAIEFVADEDRRAVLDAMKQVFETGFGSVEARFIDKDGVLIPYICNGTALRNEQGEIIGFTGTGRDISDRKQLEEDRERVLVRQQQITHLQEILLGAGDLSGKLRLITDRVVEIFDADFSRIWIMKPGDLCDSGCIHVEKKKDAEMCKSRERCLHLAASSGRYTHIDGGHQRVPFGCYKIGILASGPHTKLITNNVTEDPHVHDHEWAGKRGLKSFAGYQLRDAGGETVGVLALFSKHRIVPEEDILLESLGNSTAQVIQTSIALQALRESEDTLKTITSAAKDAIVMIDDKGKILFWNRAAEEIFGYPEMSVLGRDLHLLLAPERYHEQYLKGFAHFIRTGTGKAVGKTLELCAMRSDGVEIPIELSLQAVRIGNMWQAVGILRDITRRKSREEEREKLIGELQEALSKVKLLSGFLPICASCKKIKDDKGYWSQIESYIRNHSEAEFSHGLCPDCMKEFYKELDKSLKDLSD